MDTENMSEFYKSVCSDYRIKINPYIVEVLEKPATKENATLILSGNNRLRRVQRLDDDDVIALCEYLQNYKCVTGVDLRYNNITGEGASHLADLIQEEESHLCSLDLRFNDIETDGAEVFRQALQSNNTLLCLKLSGNKLGTAGAMHLASMLQMNSTLQELELADCDLTIEGVTALSVGLKSNKSLRSLDISRALLFSHQEEWAVHLSEMLVVNSSLVELHLAKMGMTDSGMERLAEGLKFNCSLRYLDVRCNRVTRDGVQHLAEVLKQNPSLEIIDLSFNRSEDEGAVYLSEAIMSPGCVLKELSVNSNNIRTEGLLSLSQARKARTSLTHIYIWGNHLEAPVCQAFRELMSSSCLLPEQTDVTSYEVDGQVFLAEAPHSLRRRHHSSNGNTWTEYSCPAGGTEVD